MIQHTAALARTLLLLDAADQADISPILGRDAHFVAYLTEALAPSWGADGQTLSMLKSGTGPFFRDLQQSLDELVIMGVARVEDFSFQFGADGWRLHASYFLNRSVANPIIETILRFPEEQSVSSLMIEISLGVAGVDVGALISSDVLLRDGRTSAGRLIEFRDSTGANVASNVANYFGESMPDGGGASPGEKVGLYMALLRKRADGAA